MTGFGASVRSCMRLFVEQCFGTEAGSILDEEQRQGLLRNETSTSYDDSDAISLLSNIADRSRRRQRKSAAARARLKATSLAQRWGFARDGHPTMACGLFGRPKGRHCQLATGQEGACDAQHHRHHGGCHQREESGDTDISSGGGSERLPIVDSGDEDANMIHDDAIVELSNSREQEEGGKAEEQARVEDRVNKTLDSAESTRSQRGPGKGIGRATEEEEETVTESEEAVQRRTRLDEEAEAHRRFQDEDLARAREEERALAIQEEAAIAKARRKAERKAAKEGLARFKTEAEAARRSRKLTEAEAEAAAGGFQFAEGVATDDAEFVPADNYGEFEEEQGFGRDEWTPEHQPRLALDPESHRLHSAEPYPQEQQEVVHHHFYYHEDYPRASPNLSSPSYYSSPQNLFSDQQAQQNRGFSPAIEIEEKQIAECEDGDEDEDEDEADIAGLAFGKKRSKYRESQARERDGSYGRGQSQGSRSHDGSGSRKSASESNAGSSSRYARHRQDQQRLNPILPSPEILSSGGSGSNSGTRMSYRERPRRHGRTASRSTGASFTGAREGQSSIRDTALHDRTPTFSTSPFEGLDEALQSREMIDMAASDAAADAAAGGFDME